MLREPSVHIHETATQQLEERQSDWARSDETVKKLHVMGGIKVQERSHLQDKGRSSSIFNVKSFGAKADGQTDDSQALRAAWKEACQSTGRIKLVIPKGTYLLGPIEFRGPCQNVSSIYVHMKGYLKASTNLFKYEYGGGWIVFQWVDGLTLVECGTFDGQGAQA